MYQDMGMYGLLNSDWALIWRCTIACPRILDLRQARQLPLELDEAAMIDGAAVPAFRMVILH